MKLVFIDNLHSGMVTAQDVAPPGKDMAPYIRRGTVITETMLDEMRRLQIRFAYIQDAPPPRAGRAVRNREASARQPVVTKAKPIISPQLRENALSTLEDVFSSVAIGASDVHDSAKVVRQLDTVVNQLVDSLTREQAMMVNINDLKSYDDYTYHHSLSVAVLSIAIGQYLGFNRAQLNQLGMCAMMHDIGKTAVPLDIIRKPSRLSDSEFAIVKNHSPAGQDYLVRNHIGDEEMWRGVLYHHEKVDGTGYPHGLKGDQIPLISRILSVADVYDALTSNRPYRNPMQPAEAIEFVMGGVGIQFDYDMVSAFLQRVELYPVGSWLELSNGRHAVVLSNENQMRPVVRLETGEILDLYRDHSCLSIVINRIIPS